MAGPNVNKGNKRVRVYAAGALILLSVVPSCIAEDQPPPISVTIASDAHIEPDLGRTVLHIRISNSTGHAVTLRTIDQNPPVTIYGQYGNGNPITGGTIVKNGTAKEIDYVLLAHQTKSYSAPIRDLLVTGDKLSERSSGDVSVTANFSIVNYEHNVYRVTLVHSNTIKITVAPPTR
jgi:hypothetical protein